MKKKDYIILVVLLIILFLVVSYKYILKDYFNMFLELIYFKTEERIIMTDEFTNNYIDSLESDINEYKRVSSLEDCVLSNVIYRNPSYWYQELTINKGKKDGIKKGSVVINKEGIVGVVESVMENTSIISLITNVGSNKKITVGITNAQDTIYGVIKEYNKLTNELVISELTSDIEGNDLSVVTTSFTTTFKEGIYIGKVNSIEEDSNGLSNIAKVTPVVDYNDIKYVCVEK